MAESGDEGRGSCEIETGRGGSAGRSSTGAGGSCGIPLNAEGEIGTGGEIRVADGTPELCRTFELTAEPDFGIVVWTRSSDTRTRCSVT